MTEREREREREIHHASVRPSIIKHHEYAVILTSFRSWRLAQRKRRPPAELTAADMQLFPGLNRDSINDHGSRSSQRTWLQEQERRTKATTSSFHDYSSRPCAAELLCAVVRRIGATFSPRHTERSERERERESAELLLFFFIHAIVTSLSSCACSLPFDCC